MFSYLNGGTPEFDYLMILGVDASREVRWFHPAYERAGTDPASIRIAAASQQRLLPEVVEHDLAPGRMTVYAIFSRTALHVSDIERALAQGEDLPSRLGDSVALRSIEVMVTE